MSPLQGGQFICAKATKNWVAVGGGAAWTADPYLPPIILLSPSYVPFLVSVSELIYSPDACII